MMNYDNILNPITVSLKPSGIRKYFDIASTMDDVVSLGVGEPDFYTPWHIRQAGISSLEAGYTRYTANAGLAELREEIAAYYNRRFGIKYEPKTDVLVTVGGSEAIDACFRAIVSEGDEVIVPEPSFVCYSPLVSLCRGVPVPLKTTVENNFRITPEQLKSVITPKTKLLVLPYPNNPTGGIMEKHDLEQIAEVLKDTNIMILSDEIYAELTYGGRHHVSIASIDGMKERTVIANGFSKSYSMTGWRLGYALGPKEIIKQMTKIHQFGIMSAPTTSQYAAIEALKNGDGDIVKMRDEYDMRRKFLLKSLEKAGLECFEPLGAFYAFPSIEKSGMSSDEFCEKLLYSKHVAVIPGTAFGQSGEGHIRVSYCYSLDHLKTALEKIEEFMGEL